MSPYAHYTAATDTTELATAYRGPQFFNTATVELHILDLRPSVPTRYERPNRLRRVLGSPFARHVKAATNSAILPGGACAGLILALTYLQSLAPVTAIR